MSRLRSILVAAFVSLSMAVSAQIDFGVRGGINLTHGYSVASIVDDYKYGVKSNFTIGPSVRVFIPHFFLGFDASALYAYTAHEVATERVSYSNIVFPVNARISLVGPLYVFAGPQFAFPLGDKSFSFHQLTEVDYSIKSANLSLNFGAGITFKGLQLSLQYNIPCGKAGDFNVESVWNNYRLDRTSNTIQLALGCYF